MRYLYGDSTESALELNYLAFLRDVVDAAVAILLADGGLQAARERRTGRERAAATAVSDLEEFGRQAGRFAEPIAREAGDSPVGRCAGAVASAAEAAVRREIALVRTGLAGDLEQIDAESQRQRARATAALGALLAAHDLPGGDESLEVTRSGGGYQATLRQKTDYGVEVAIDLEIPSSSLFAHDVRIDRVADGIEIHAPETAGWLRKELKMVPNKLARYHLTQVDVTREAVLVSVRAGAEAGASGFDLAMTPAGAIQVERTGDAAGGFDTDPRDTAGLTRLCERLEGAARDLREHRGRLEVATIDEVPLTQHAHPRILVERLVDAIAPTVREIAERSLTPRELVLKRLLAGDRREEIFVSKAELAEKLEPLTPPQRRVLAPLGFVEDAEPPRRAARPSVPPPVPPPRPGPAAAVASAAVDVAIRELDDEE